MHPSRRLLSSRTFVTALTAGTMALTAACSDSNSPSTPAGKINLVNASPTAATISLRRDGAGFIAGLQYGSSASKTTVADTSTHVFTAAIGSDTTTVATSSFKVKEDSAYTLVFVKRVAGSALATLPFTATAPANGHAKVRLVNYGTAAVDVYVTDSTTDIATATANTANLVTEAAGAYIDYTAAAKRVRVTTAGTKTVLFDHMLTLTNGQVASILFLDPATAGQANKFVVLVDLNP